VVALVDCGVAISCQRKPCPLPRHGRQQRKAPSPARRIETRRDWLVPAGPAPAGCLAPVACCTTLLAVSPAWSRDGEDRQSRAFHDPAQRLGAWRGASVNAHGTSPAAGCCQRQNASSLRRTCRGAVRAAVVGHGLRRRDAKGSAAASPHGPREAAIESQILCPLLPHGIAGGFRTKRHACA